MKWKYLSEENYTFDQGLSLFWPVSVDKIEFHQFVLIRPNSGHCDQFNLMLFLSSKMESTGFLIYYLLYMYF